MRQEHTEESIQHTEDQQNTGNHKKPGAPDAKGADRFGGTRAGAENVEPKPTGSPDSDRHAAETAHHREDGSVKPP
jgi:hypothetical protein